MSEQFAGVFPRGLQVAYWLTQPRVVDRDRLRLEKYLQQLGSVKVEERSTFDGALAESSDLLIIAAQGMDESQFPSWLQMLRLKMREAGAIWTPALILAYVDFSTLNEVFTESVQENWYFDILSPDHLSSIPIRVANLIRIQDHLKELTRYASTLEQLAERVEHLELELEALKAK